MSGWITYVRGIIHYARICALMEGVVGKVRTVGYSNGKRMIYAWDRDELEVQDYSYDKGLKLEKEMLDAIDFLNRFISKGVNHIKDDLDLLFLNTSEILGDSNIIVDAFDEFHIPQNVPKIFSYSGILNNCLYDLKQNFDEKKLEELQRKYWWVEMGWERVKVLTAEDLMMKMDQITERLEEFEEGKNIESFYAGLHDIRKELQMKSVYAVHLILLKISEDYDVEYMDLEWLSFEELKAIIDGKDYSDIIKKRKKEFYFVSEKDKVHMYYGEKARRLGTQLLKVEQNDYVKGRPVFGGVVRGYAKICRGVHEAEEITEKDILITGMTMPDYVPYMKKAAAIVTNEGGVTCHAAIIAGEIKKPCVVGTVHATEIFRDGDLIEVDANKGMVRKIEQ